MPFPGPGNAYPTKDEVADYLERYATTMSLPVRTGIEARQMTRVAGDAWTIEATGQTLIADAVIIATGGYQTPKIPAWATDLDPDVLQLHSLGYRNRAQFQPGPVLVVGASHSGAEIAIEAARNHQTMLVGRDTGQVPIRSDGRLDRLVTPLIWFAVNHVLTVDTPMGRKAKGQFRAHGFPLERTRRSDLKDAGVERITVRATGVRDGKPMLDDGRVLDVTNVVWCTGFQGDYSWIEGLTYGEDGYPEQERGVVRNTPGLYFVGLKFQRTGASSLVGGVGRDAEIVADHIAVRARHTA
jgi:putative flavoprotein involved in K+ transport